MAVDLSMPILVVDDHRTVARILQKLLASLGFGDVETAASGEEALARLEGRPYGLVISDWSMEPMGGDELVRRLRGDAARRGTPFILVSADDRPEKTGAARAAGADTYLPKPFDAQELKACMNEVLGPF